MGKTSTKFELILLFHNGFTIDEIVAMGYQKETAKHYQMYYTQAYNIFQKLIKK